MSQYDDGDDQLITPIIIVMTMIMSMALSTKLKGDQEWDAIFGKKGKKRTNGRSFVNPPATTARHSHAEAHDDDFVDFVDLQFHIF